MIDRILNLIYPPRCILCERVISSTDNYICHHCSGIIHTIEGLRCKKCSRSIQKGELCSTCLNEEHDFEFGKVLYDYDDTIKEALYRFKYNGDKNYAQYFGKQIYYKYSDIINDMDLMIPVPVHRKKLKSRGYNQSKEIIKVVSELSGIPYVDGVLIRKHDTRPQNKLSIKSRKNNLKDAFDIDAKFDDNKYKNILLIDDIYTTGSTINSCARVIKQNHDVKVYFIAVAISLFTPNTHN